jgi:hypothetical protein
MTSRYRGCIHASGQKIALRSHTCKGKPRSAPFTLPDRLRAPKSEATCPLDFAKKFDAADRMFHSIGDTWDSCLANPADLKELIPEFVSQNSVYEKLDGTIVISMNKSIAL